MAPLRATYRLQLGARASASRRRASSSRTCATSASATSTCRRRSRRARARRTATTSSTRRAFSEELGGERGVPTRSRRPCARPGLGDRARHRPEPHGDRRRQPLLGRPGAARAVLRHRPGAPGATGASSTSTTSPACARRTRRCSRRRTSSRCGSCARASSTGCGSTIRTGSPTRPATCARLRDGGAEHVWVEKILDPGEQLRDWPVEGTVGYEFLNDVAALFVDPAGEAPLTDLWVELSGDDRPFGEVAFEAKLEQARDDVRARGRAAAARRAARRRRARARARLAARSTAPTSSRGRAASRTPTARRSARPACRSRCSAC